MPRSREGDKKLRKTPFRSYAQWAQEIGPRVQAALSGKLKVPVQRPSTEAWLTYALYWGGSQLSLEAIIYNADVVNHSILDADEIAWALLRLRQRKWLSEQQNSYGLTAEGRRAVEGVIGKSDLRENMEQLKEWMLAHPAPKLNDH